MSERITIEVFPDYIETIIAALKQKRDWHERENKSELGDEAIVAWITQIIKDLEKQEDAR